MQIRKISIGGDYKSSSMHYIIGQSVIGGDYQIHEIQEHKGSYRVWIVKDNEVVLWKEFNSNMPVSIEYNIQF
jgi:hypothetical protein|tara:strand:- start:4254 stop:4472 length:219 start_codon:yes stop_codon:yes gene_type:complete